MVLIDGKRVSIVKKRTRRFTRHESDRYHRVKVGVNFPLTSTLLNPHLFIAELA